MRPLCSVQLRGCPLRAPTALLRVVLLACGRSSLFTLSRIGLPGNRQTGSQARHHLPQQAHLILSLAGLTSGPFVVANASRVLGSSLFEVL